MLTLEEESLLTLITDLVEQASIPDQPLSTRRATEIARSGCDLMAAEIDRAYWQSALMHVRKPPTLH